MKRVLLSLSFVFAVSAAHAADPIWVGSAFDANTLQGQSAAAGSAPSLTAGGPNSDANASLSIAAKGTGTLTLGGASNTVNLAGSTIKSGGTTAVSCAANSVSLTTLVVTNGIVTHC